MSKPESFESFYAIKIGGTQLTNAELARLHGALEITISAEDDDQAKFAFDETTDYHFQSRYKENMDVLIEFGHLRGERSTYEGEISAPKPDFPTSGVPSIAFECSSKAKQGHERQKSRTFKEKKYSEVAEQIAKEHGWTSSVIPTADVIRQVTQAGETDMQLLRRIASKINFIVKVVGTTLYFGPQPLTGEESGTFDYRMGNFLLRSFKPKFETQDKGKRVSASNISEKEQKQVTSRAWGTTEKLGLTGGTELVATSNAGSWSYPWSKQGSGNPAVPIAHRPAEPTLAGKPEPINRQEAMVDLEQSRGRTGTESVTQEAVGTASTQAAAQAGAVSKATLHYLRDTGEGGALPDNTEDLEKAVEAKQRQNEKVVGGSLEMAVCKPNIKGNSKVVLRGVGPRFSGTYFVEKATHTISSSGALTKLDVSRNALGDDTKGTGKRSKGAGAGTQPQQSKEKHWADIKGRLGLNTRKGLFKTVQEVQQDIVLEVSVASAIAKAKGLFN